MVRRLRQREKWKIKRELRKDRRRGQGETAKGNEDRLNGDLPNDVPADRSKVKFVEAEDKWPRKAEDGDEQVGKGINEFLIMK